jgi:site-specific DNA-methyltransferase (adenine-specific)
MRIKMDLRNCDCMDLMKEFPDKYFELAIVDPPYGLDRYNKNDGGNSNKIKSFGDKDKNWNNIKPDNLYFKELFRISQNQIIWGGNNFELPLSEYFIIWDKGQMMPSFAQCEMAWTNCKKPAKIFKQRTVEQGRIKIHPTQKPIALYRWLLQNYAKKGDKILDTHLGSMSSVIACYDEKFDITGAELDPDYFKAGMERVNKHTSQVRLDDLI